MIQLLNKLISGLRDKGFSVIPLPNNNNNVYGKVIDDVMYVVVLMQGDNALYENVREYDKSVVLMLASGAYKDVQVLNLFLTPDGMITENVMNILNKMTNVWLVSAKDGRVYIYENQIGEFAGVRQIIETSTRDLSKANAKTSTRKKRGPLSRYSGVSFLTIILVAINIIIFVLSCINTNTDYMTIMANNLDAVIKDGQYYRLITAMFYHFSLSHLFCNMILLFAVGRDMERDMGHIIFIASYFLVGVCSSLCSLLSCYYGEAYDYGAGASGAVFGLVGILIIFAIYGERLGRKYPLQNLIMLVLLNVANGLANSEVDNAAHMGGLLGGLIVGLIYVFIHGIANKNRKGSRL